MLLFIVWQLMVMRTLTVGVSMTGRGCGSVGREVAYDTRGLWFEYSDRQNFQEHLFTVNCIEKKKIKKKGNSLLKKV